MAKELESSKNHRVLVGTMMEQSSYSGPLPKPSDFAAYKETLPSAPERIMTMAEEEQTHRHTLEKQIVGSAAREKPHRSNPSIYTRYCLPWCRNLSRRARSRYACRCNHCHNCSIGFYFLFEENPEKRQLKITLIPCFS